MQIGGKHQAIRVLDGPENAINKEDYSRVLGNAIIERAAIDMRKCMKRDKKHKIFSFNGADKYGPINTAQIAYFFSSPLCILCCGEIDPWYILGKIAIEMNYPYMDELEKEYERGLEDNERKRRMLLDRNSRSHVQKGLR